ncbi:MAG: F0F1 ATP synthase subunit B [Planctomycetes bacterium]|nr:F0F1 ATP synthase subunit B [Planctomycetota bacterium]
MEVLPLGIREHSRRAMRQLLLMIFSVCCFVNAAWAVDEPAGHSEGSNIFAGQLWLSIFTLMIFGILLAILGKFAWRPLLEGLQKREDHIRHSIEDAEKMRNEANEILESYQQQLTEAREESRKIIEQGRVAARRLADEMEAKSQATAQSLRERAQRDIGAAKQQALREVYEQISHLATEVASKIVQRTLTPDDHRELLEQSLSKIEKEAF